MCAWICSLLPALRRLWLSVLQSHCQKQVDMHKCISVTGSASLEQCNYNVYHTNSIDYEVRKCVIANWPLCIQPLDTLRHTVNTCLCISNAIISYSNLGPSGLLLWHLSCVSYAAEMLAPMPTTCNVKGFAHDLQFTNHLALLSILYKLDCGVLDCVRVVDELPRNCIT